MRPSLGGGQIYRTQANPVNTGNFKTGVQIEGNRVLLTHNGGRWVEDSVHVANIAELGKDRQSAVELVTVVPHQRLNLPPQNLMSVSGNQWSEHTQSQSTKRDEIIHTYSPPAELTPRQYPTRPTTKATTAKPKSSGFLSNLFASLFGTK